MAGAKFLRPNPGRNRTQRASLTRRPLFVFRVENNSARVAVESPFQTIGRTLNTLLAPHGQPARAESGLKMGEPFVGSRSSSFGSHCTISREGGAP